MKTNNHLNININNEMFINQPYLCINVLINDIIILIIYYGKTFY